MDKVLCTLFNREYVYKGLALYQTIARHFPDFTLWILCMDDETYKLLSLLNLKSVRLISMDEFETEELIRAKKQRSVAEYCWTCTAPLMKYIMLHESNAEHVTYLDADLYFFSDAQPIYSELASNSILIVEHRFSDERRHWETITGKYNVSIVIFRRDLAGFDAVERWTQQCIDNCQQELSGDQKYLDEWPNRYKNLVVLEHKGSGVAPWNIDNYIISKRGSQVYIDDVPLVFYHFSSFIIGRNRILSKYAFRATSEGDYRYNQDQLALIHRPYARELLRIIDKIQSISPDFRYGHSVITPRTILKDIRRGNVFFEE